MTPLAETDKLFFERADATLDRAAAEHVLGEALAASDDGELFLEYRESESISLDDGRIRSAGFDTTLGFGLRAVAGRGDRLRPCRRAVRGGAAPRRGQRGARSRPAIPAPRPSRRAPPMRGCIPTPTRWARHGFPAAHGAAGGDRRLCPRQGSARQAGHGLAHAASGRRCRSCAPTARASPTCGRWCG